MNPKRSETAVFGRRWQVLEAPINYAQNAILAQLSPARGVC